MSDKGQRVRDPEGTQTAIIDAAERLFAENGFAATSMRDISTASSVSHPLIHHHFGSKEELYSAVKRRLVEGYAKQFPRAARAVHRPIGVRAEMRRLMAFLGDNPMLLRLCLRTRLEGDNQVWPGEPDQLDTMRQRIEVSQRRGLIRADLDATNLSVMILGLVCFCLENREHFSHRFGAGFDVRSYLRQAIALVERGLAPGPDDQAAEDRSPAVEATVEPD
jgi:TetR/AcrR family transcriptional regulator